MSRSTKLIMFCLLAVAQGAVAQDLPASTRPWEEFNVFELRASSVGASDFARYQGQFDRQSDDIQLNVEVSDGGKIKKGKILMIGGRVMATQGPIVEKGFEIDALDAAVLQQQMVVRVLERLFPRGSADVGKSRDIDFREEKTDIRVATPSAEGGLAAPWQVRGGIRQTAPGVFDYDFRLSAKRPGSERQFLCRLSHKEAVRIDDALKLDGWELFGVGVQARKEQEGTIYDYSAARADTRYVTVADVRRKLAADDYPGEPDPTKSFIGFWKENCEDAFGLQILPHGTQGEYTVGFCGPGGCDNPANERPTFITKDPHYEVVNENEIRSGSEIYHKCTNDPHPVLKYKDDQ